MRLPILLVATVAAKPLLRHHPSLSDIDLNEILYPRHSGRHLQVDRACNEQIGVITTDEVVVAMTAYYSVLFVDDPDLFAASVETVQFLAQYDSAVWKLCHSCEELAATGLDLPDACGPDQYGYDAQLSSLVFVPLDPATNAPLSGLLRGVYNFHGAKMTVTQAPTVQWPANITAEVANIDQTADPTLIVQWVLSNLFEGLTLMVAASQGAIGIAPDYIGYGSSQATLNRTLGILPTYQTAGVVSQLGTQGWISEYTANCTQLDNVVTLFGTSEGGYAAGAVAPVFVDMGIDILAVKTGVMLTDPEQVLAGAFAQYNDGLIDPSKNNILFQAYLPVSGLAYSIDLPSLANSGTNQSTLSETWRDQVLEWVSNPNPLTLEQVIGVMPSYAPEIFNEDFLALVNASNAQGLSNPCSSDFIIVGQTDLLCEALESNSLLPLLEAATYDFDICYTPGDTIIPVTQYPESLFANSSFVKNASEIAGIPAFGDHGTGAVFCALNMFIFLAGPDRASDASLSPTLIQQVDDATCQTTQPPSPTTGPVPTAAPVAPTEPSPAPVAEPTTSAPTTSAPTSAGSARSPTLWLLAVGAIVAAW